MTGHRPTSGLLVAKLVKSFEASAKNESLDDVRYVKCLQFREGQTSSPLDETGHAPSSA